MKSYRKELWFNVPGRRGLINITPQVDTCLRESGIREGLCLVNAMHITARVFINDDERGLHADYEEWLEDVRSKLRQAPTSPSAATATTAPARRSPGRSTGTTETPI